MRPSEFMSSGKAARLASVWIAQLAILAVNAATAGWSEATVRLELPPGNNRERFTTAVGVIPPDGAVLEIDDLLLYEPGR